MSSPFDSSENIENDMTLNDINKAMAELDAYALKIATRYLPEGGEMVTVELTSHLLSHFYDHMASFQIFKYYSDYVCAVVASQQEHYNSEIFAPESVDVTKGLQIFNGEVGDPQEGFKLYLYYYLPLTFYAVTFHTHFSYFLDPIRHPERAAMMDTYALFRENQTCIAIQVHYQLLRKTVHGEISSHEKNETKIDLAKLKDFLG